MFHSFVPNVCFVNIRARKSCLVVLTIFSRRINISGFLFCAADFLRGGGGGGVVAQFFWAIYFFHLQVVQNVFLIP